jgi:hypothetical protein
MVIVTGTALESGGMPCRLDPAHQPGAGTGGQHVVHGLGKHRSQPLRHPAADLLGGSVGMLSQPLQHRLARRGYPQPGLAKLMADVRGTHD